MSTDNGGLSMTQKLEECTLCIRKWTLFVLNICYHFFFMCFDYLVAKNVLKYILALRCSAGPAPDVAAMNPLMVRCNSGGWETIDNMVQQLLYIQEHFLCWKRSPTNPGNTNSMDKQKNGPVKEEPSDQGKRCLAETDQSRERVERGPGPGWNEWGGKISRINC